MAYLNVQEKPQPFLFRYLNDLFNYRHLCANLVASDLRARFRRSKLGVLWAILQPLLFSILLAIVWGGVFKVENIWEFALYVFAGQIVWEAFGNCFVGAQDSLGGAEGYIKQTRIPFFIFQVRFPLTALTIMFFGLLGVLGMAAVLGRLPSIGLHLLLIPAFFGVYLMFLIPLAISMSILGTLFRDVKHISHVALQAMFFISPVMLQREVLSADHLELLTIVNPMVPVLDMFRDPTLYSRFWDPKDIVVLSAWIVALVAAARAGRRIVFAL